MKDKFKAKSFKLRLKRFVIFYVIVALLAFFGYPQVASAGNLTALSDVMTRLKENTLSSHDITFTLAAFNTFSANETITIDFGEDDGKFTVNGATSAIADFGLNDGDERTIVGVDGSCVGHEDPSDVAVGINDATGVVTFTACASYITSGATINIEYGTAAAGTNRVTNPAGAANYVLPIAGTFGDTGQFAVVIVTDDQVVVNATIDPYITFTITTNTVTLTKSGGGNPSYTSTGYNQGAANTLAAATNGATGYTITYNGATLTSGAYTIDAMAAKAASSTGTEQFGINLKDNATPDTGTNPSGGTGAPAADYNTADEFKFAAGATTTLATAAAPTATTTFTVTYIVNVAAVTQAAAYQTTITYVCTGNF